MRLRLEILHTLSVGSFRSAVASLPCFLIGSSPSRISPLAWHVTDLADLYAVQVAAGITESDGAGEIVTPGLRV